MLPPENAAIASYRLRSTSGSDTYGKSVSASPSTARRLGVTGATDVPVLERLRQLFWHDLSELHDSYPGPDGPFPFRELRSYAGTGDRARTVCQLEPGVLMQPIEQQHDDSPL